MLSIDDESVQAYDEQKPRSVAYEPKKNYMGGVNKMKWGAYSRWRLAEMKVQQQKEMKKKAAKSNNFFDAIKKLGSGPAPKVQ